MNFGEMQRFVQDRLLEGYSNSDTLTLDMIKRAINSSLRDFSVETEFLRNTANQNIVASQADYAVPTDAIKPLRAYVLQSNGEYKLIEQRDYEEVNDNKDFWTSSDTPYYWFEKMESNTKTISVFPTPTYSLTNGLRIAYIQLHPELSLDNTESLLSEEEVEAPLYFATYLIADADGDSPALAQRMLAMYNQKKVTLIRQKDRQRQTVLTLRSGSHVNKRNYVANY